MNQIINEFILRNYRTQDGKTAILRHPLTLTYSDWVLPFQIPQSVIEWLARYHTSLGNHHVAFFFAEKCGSEKWGNIENHSW